MACAQQVPPVSNTQIVPRTGSQAGADAGVQTFDAQHLKDRPYNGALPKPPYPSTDRVQRTFTAAYVYDYAYSSYTPPVALPVVGRAAFKRDTPESALIALVSAMKSGDFEAFVQCWAEPDRKALQDIAKDPKALAGMKQGWREVFNGKSITLLDRVEVMGYVILDMQVQGTPQPYPSIFKLQDGQWLASNDLARSGSQMLMNFSTDRAGVIEHVQPTTGAVLNAPAASQEADAQADFLKLHDTRSSVVKAGK